MDTLIGFLRSTETFLADLPDIEFVGPLARSTLDLGWTKSSIAHLPPGITAVEGGEYQLSERVYASNVPVDIYDAVDRDSEDAMTILSWALTSGQLCTQLPAGTQVRTREGIQVLLGSLGVQVDRQGLPRISLGPPLTGGDPRVPLELDDVSFIPIGEADPDVVFLDSQAVSGTTTHQDSEHSEVSVAGPLGITVKAAGSTLVPFQIVRDTAVSVAESLVRVAS